MLPNHTPDNCPIKDKIDVLEKQVNVFPGIKSDISEIRADIQDLKNVNAKRDENNSRYYWLILAWVSSMVLPVILKVVEWVNHK
jgi:hypothetical protein